MAGAEYTTGAVPGTFFAKRKSKSMEREIREGNGKLKEAPKTLSLHEAMLSHRPSAGGTDLPVPALLQALLRFRTPVHSHEGKAAGKDGVTARGHPSSLPTASHFAQLTQ